MDDHHRLRWQTLVNLFGVKKPGIAPWNAELIAKNVAGANHAERCAIQFMLNVWDPNGNWDCGQFNVIEAFRVWDEEYREAFLRWADDPWWP